MSTVRNNDTNFRPKVLRKFWEIFRKLQKVEFTLSKVAVLKMNSSMHVLLELFQSFQSTYFSEQQRMAVSDNRHGVFF